MLPIRVQFFEESGTYKVLNYYSFVFTLELDGRYNLRKSAQLPVCAKLLECQQFCNDNN